MPTEHAHLDRARAQSFGAVAEAYDRGRLPYSSEFFDDLAALKPQRVLDVACGTGRAARPLIKRGLKVLGVEVDERMAKVAREHGVPVELAEFEDWDDADRRFDLLTCGEAWHWIDPAKGVEKAAKVLSPGGTIARFWGYNVVDQPLRSALEKVYERHATDVHAHAKDPDDENEGPDPFARSEAFSPVEKKLYWTESTLTADEWVRVVSTYSDHHRLGEDGLAVVARALRETIETFGGTVPTRTVTFVVLARRLP